ncbi:MAG: hypothetical protein QW343_01020 [Candidatus Norongarragalinales archaeon]
MKKSKAYKVIIAVFALIIAVVLAADFFPALFAVNFAKALSCNVNEAVARLTGEWALGLNTDGKSFPYIECDLDRGGYVKAKITQGAESVDVCYHWGWCSSGGQDCGWTLVLSGSEKNGLYDEVKRLACGKLVSKRNSDEEYCQGTVFDDSARVQAACLAGEFEYAGNGIKTLRLKQEVSRCTYHVEKGPSDCSKQD